MEWPLCSRGWFSGFSRRGRRSAARLLGVLGLCVVADIAAIAAPGVGSIQLDVRPRICTLAADDDVCRTVVEARWRSSQNESLCLVIVGQPHVRRCWEDYSEGVYRVELSFDEDLLVQLRDPALAEVLATQAINVVKEALRLRRKRRQPWNILN